MKSSPDETRDTTELVPSPVPKTAPEAGENVPAPPRPLGTAPHKSGLPLILGGILLGVVGTSLVIPRLRTSPAKSQPPSVQQETPGREPAPSPEGEPGHIHLSAEALEKAGIRAESARFVPLGESLMVPGTVEVSPNRAAKITPPTPGKVARLLVNLGQTVRIGQPLVVLDSYEVAQARAAVRQAESNVQQARSGIQTAHAEVDQARASVEQAKADVEQTRTRQASVETVLQRQRRLAQAGAFSQAPLQAAQTELTTAQSELQQAQAELQTRTAQLQRTERLFKEELVSRSDFEAAQLEQKQNQITVSRAEARVAIARQALQREQTVFQGGLLNAREVQTAEADVRAAQGDVQKARQGVLRAQQDVSRAQKGEQAAQTALRGAEEQLRATRANLYALQGAEQAENGGLITIHAPISGTVTERQASLGEAVERSTPLFVLENLNAVTVNANVSEKDVARIHVGQPARISVAAYPNQVFAGVIQSVGGRVDEKTRTLPVRCVVENRGGKLRPDMFANVALGVNGHRSALAVPLKALDDEGDQQYVFVEEDGYERRKVQLGRRSESMAEIVSGVKPGEKVVTAGVFVLKSEGKKAELKGDND